MNAKQRAALGAVPYVKDGMKLGLGTGSTVYYFIEEVGKLVADGMQLTCVSTSERTTAQAVALGIPVVDLNTVDRLDLVVDGADEIDPNRNGIKGGGGALFREKMVALAAETCIWIVDESKMVDALGDFPLPVEIVPFGYLHTVRAVEKLGYTGTIRMAGADCYVTDNGNYILDLNLPKGYDPYAVEDALRRVNGVVETGLFLDICDIVCVGAADEQSIEFSR
ncbi:MAG: ribose-5-phosphate isomerase RpiA [Eubacteriales bacterium]|nr:ribose-5-phosphate isomerase RpiA [Eubacteriales bacterium]